MDDEPIGLDVGIQGAYEAAQRMREMAQSVRTIQAPLNTAAEATQRMTRNLQSALGPAQRLQRALTELRAAAGSGNPSAMFDAQYRVLQAQKSYQRAQNALNPQRPSLPSQIMDVFRSSRFGMGGGGVSLMPLVGKVMDLLGPAVTGAVAGFTAVMQAAQSAAESLTNFKDAMVTSGGSAGEVGRLNALGGAAGIADMSGMSRQFAEKIATDGAAAAFARTAGIYDHNGAYSEMDKATNLQKALDHLVNLPHTQQGDMEAARFARVEGLEAALKLRDISRETYENLKRAGEVNAAAHGVKETRDAAEFNAQLSMMKTNFDTLNTDIGSMFLPSFSGVIGLFNDFAKPLHDAYIGLKPIIDLTQRLSGLGLLGSLHDGIQATRRAMEDKSGAEKEHTEAMKEHARALRSGISGGGERARGAVPAAWGGSNAPNWKGQARMLGAFNF